MAIILPGRYRHYKGKEYTVIGEALHSETLEELVVYRQEYGDHGLGVRPKRMFLETVEVDGQEVPRFQQIAPGVGGFGLASDGWSWPAILPTTRRTSAVTTIP
jgi:hypothetical protein